MGLALFFLDYMLYAVIPTSILFWRELINQHNIIYNGNGYKLLEREPPLGDRLALFAFLARGERTGRSVITPQVVLFLHFVDAHNPVVGSKCLLCKTACTIVSA